MLAKSFALGLLALFICQASANFLLPTFGLYKLSHGLESFNPITACELFMRVCPSIAGKGGYGDCGPYKGVTALWCQGIGSNGDLEDRTSSVIDTINGSLEASAHKWAIESMAI
ncbi:hypothetical protein CBOM_04198 [Ceraceosorus bombacis]|uniref:Uncharacterized protein n=1 Tax=Ceraceosorus bombacis TaxID=401625 RepID=A0A0N7LAX6_9BASI|nr:hypothetical protein CBOM_04198 [Ceraceosorus bombacis]